MVFQDDLGPDLPDPLTFSNPRSLAAVWILLYTTRPVEHGWMNTNLRT